MEKKKQTKKKGDAVGYKVSSTKYSNTKTSLDPLLKTLVGNKPPKN